MPVVFDIGGVIFEDVWETIFFEQTKGLTKTFNLDPNHVNEVCVNLWEHFAISNQNGTTWQTLEHNYWKELLSNLQIPLSIEECIDYSQNFLIPIPGVNKLINLLADNHIQLGICSNQTAFWFERQLTISSGLQRINRSNMVLSFEQGITKDSKSHHLFKQVVHLLDCPPNEIIYIEDRPRLQQSAKKFGFKTILFDKRDTDFINTIKKQLLSYEAMLQEQNS